jgi:hypothetical protein
MSYDEFRTSYKIESTWNTDAIANRTTPTNWLGLTDTENLALPDPITTTMKVRPAAGIREAADTIRTQQNFRNRQAILLQNGHLLYVCLGKVTTNASGAFYVHDVAPTRNATTGVATDRPSITIHSESVDSTGSLTDTSRHFTGVRMASMLLEQSAERVLLAATVDWIGGNATTWSKTSLTTSPTDFGSKAMYDFADTTITYNGLDIKQGLQSIQVNIAQGTVGRYGQRGSNSHLPQFQTDSDLIAYDVQLVFLVSNFTLWTDNKEGGTRAENTLVVKFQVSADDYIQLTFEDTHPVVSDYPEPRPDSGQLARVEFKPEKLRVQVKDSVASF